MSLRLTNKISGLKELSLAELNLHMGSEGIVRRTKSAYFEVCFSPLCRRGIIVGVALL